MKPFNPTGVKGGDDGDISSLSAWPFPKGTKVQEQGVQEVPAHTGSTYLSIQ